MRRSSSGHDEEEDDDMLERPNLEDEDDSLVIDPTSQRSLDQDLGKRHFAYSQILAKKRQILAEKRQIIAEKHCYVRRDPILRKWHHLLQFPISRKKVTFDDSFADDDDDSNKPQDSFLEDSYGSPAGQGLRQSLSILDDDDDTKEESSSTPDLQSRKNKRKNFKPRNILSDTSAAKVALNINKNKNLLPQKRDNSPMDLSVQGANGVDLIDGESDDQDSNDDTPSEGADPPGGGLGMNPSAGLSVVRPEVLFGQAPGLMGAAGGMGLDPKLGLMQGVGAGGPPLPPFLAPFLAASREAQSGAPSMKEAFQEVLKLFGLPPELAEVFARNAQAMQQQQQQEANDTNSTDEGTNMFENYLLSLFLKPSNKIILYSGYKNWALLRFQF